MKLPIALAVIVLAASLVGFVQHRELAALRERSAELAASTNIADPAPMDAATGRPAGDGGGRDAVEATVDVEEARRTPFVPSPSVDVAALDFVQRAEEAVREGSMVKVATKMVPELNRASPEFLKAVLIHLENADVPDEGKLMGYSTILSKLVKTEPASAVAAALDAAEHFGEPRGSGILRKVIGSWAASDPSGLERWFETARADGTIPDKPEDIYASVAAHVAVIAARRDLGEAWAMLEANADHNRAVTRMLSLAREEIGGPADWERMAGFALETDQESLGREAALMLAVPNFRHGTPEQQIAHSERILAQYPGLVAIYADRAIERAGATGSVELAAWALPRAHEGQRQALIDQYIGKWAKRDPDAVAGLAATIQDGELREMVEAVLDGVPSAE